MGEYKIRLSPKAKAELKQWEKIGDKSTLSKIERIILELAEHPAMGTGQVERLKGDLSGYWSRRLNKKDRMIYKIDDVEAIVHLLSFKGHYE